jgi:hypothetical protein
MHGLCLPDVVLLQMLQLIIYVCGPPGLRHVRHVYMCIQVVKQAFIGQLLEIRMQILTSGSFWGDFKNTNEGEIHLIIVIEHE